MQLKKREAHRVLKKLNFTSRKGKEKVAQFYHDGKWILFTSIPKGKGDLHVSDKFRNQLKLNNAQLRDAINCPFGYDEYIEHLSDIGLI